MSSSNGSEAAQKSDCTNNAGGEGIDVGNRKGADILLKIHDHLDLDRLQKVKVTTTFYLRHRVKLDINACMLKQNPHEVIRVCFCLYAYNIDYEAISHKVIYIYIADGEKRPRKKLTPLTFSE